MLEEIRVFNCALTMVCACPTERGRGISPDARWLKGRALGAARVEWSRAELLLRAAACLRVPLNVLRAPPFSPFVQNSTLPLAHFKSEERNQLVEREICSQAK